MLVRILVAAVITVIVIAGPMRAAQPHCGCENLAAIHDAMNEAKSLRALFEAKANELEREELRLIKKLGRFAAQSDEMKRLHENYNHWIHEEAERSVEAAGTRVATKTEFESKSCEPNEKQMRAMMNHEPCAEMAKALKQHEDFHHDVCVARKASADKKIQRRTQTPIDRDRVISRWKEYDLSSAEAWNEVGAYTEQIAYLEALSRQLDSRCEQSVYCPCNKKTYADERQCNVECPRGLACFAVRCTTPPPKAISESPRSSAGQIAAALTNQ